MGYLATGEIFENMLQSGACPGIRKGGGAHNLKAFFFFFFFFFAFHFLGGSPGPLGPPPGHAPDN